MGGEGGDDGSPYGKDWAVVSREWITPYYGGMCLESRHIYILVAPIVKVSKPKARMHMKRMGATDTRPFKPRKLKAF